MAPQPPAPVTRAPEPLPTYRPVTIPPPDALGIVLDVGEAKVQIPSPDQLGIKVDGLVR